MSPSTTIDLIDDDAAVLDALGMYLERRGLKVNRYSKGGEFTKAIASGVRSDCVVSDIRMPGMSGMDLQRWLVAHRHSMPLILMTGYADIGIAVAAMKAGAFDFLEKPVDERHLMTSIRQAVSQAHERSILEQELAGSLDRIRVLSEREQEVFWLTSRGKTSREIGAELGISPRTVEIHRASVLEKTRSATLADLVRLAVSIENVEAAKSHAR